MNFDKPRAEPHFGGTSSMSPHLPARPGGRADLPVRLPNSMRPHLHLSRNDSTASFRLRPGGASVPASRRHRLLNVVKLAAIVLSGRKIGLAADRKTTGFAWPHALIVLAN